MAIKYLFLSIYTSMQVLENNNWIILDVKWNNSDTFRELIQNNTTHSLSEFISNNTETFREILHTRQTFVRVNINQYWHFCRVASKNFSSHLSDCISHNTFSGSYYTFFQSSYQTILAPLELPRNTTVT